MSPTITQEEVGFLARLNGLTLSEAQIAELASVYPMMAEMSALNHAPRGIAAEPSNVFVPGEGFAK